MSLIDQQMMYEFIDLFFLYIAVALSRPFVGQSFLVYSHSWETYSHEDIIEY